jgi:hypothetical protein
MTFKNRTDVPFIGGPLAGTVASNSRVIYRDAIDGKTVPVAYGDRWTIRHQRHADDPKVAAKLAGLYPDKPRAATWTPTSGRRPSTATGWRLVDLTGG